MARQESIKKEAIVQLDESYKDLRVAYQRAVEQLRDDDSGSVTKDSLPTLEKFIFARAAFVTGKQYTNLIDLIEEFLKKRLIFQNSLYKDISLIISDLNKGNLITLMQLTISELQRLENKKKQKQDANDYEVVLKSQNMIVYKPNNTASSCKLGKGTQWCTSATNSQNYFDQYNKNGDLFYVHTKNKNEKIAFYIYNDQPKFEIFDAQDESISVLAFKRKLDNAGVNEKEWDQLTKKFPVLNNTKLDWGVNEAIVQRRKPVRRLQSGSAGQLAKSVYNLEKAMDTLKNLDVYNPENDGPYLMRLLELIKKLQKIITGVGDKPAGQYITKKYDNELFSSLVHECINEVSSYLKKNKLTEIENLTNYDKDISPMDTVELDRKKWKKVGEIKSYDLYERKKVNGFEYQLIDGDVDLGTEDYALSVGMFFLKVSTRKRSQKVVKVISELAPELHGKGIAIEVYMFFLREKGFTLMSDVQQSPGGRSIWRKLVADENVSTYAWNPNLDDKHSLQPIDPADFDSAYEDVFAHELYRAKEAEIEYAKKIARSKEEFNEFKERIEKAYKTEITQALDTQYIRLLAKWGKTKKDLDEVKLIDLDKNQDGLPRGSFDSSFEKYKVATALDNEWLLLRADSKKEVHYIVVNKEQYDKEQQETIARPSNINIRGRFVFNAYPSPNPEPFFQVVESTLDTSIQGKGFAYVVYKHAILKDGFNIMSDHDQSRGGQAIWKKLTKDPSVEVYVYDEQAETLSHTINLDDSYYSRDELAQIKKSRDAAVKQAKEELEGNERIKEIQRIEKEHSAEIGDLNRNSYTLLVAVPAGQTTSESLKEHGGRIVKGVNTTPDVGTDEIKKQAAKFGNKVDKGGVPPKMSSSHKNSTPNKLFNIGMTESKKHNANFKRWFAGSKVVDDQGKPMMVFHGTGSDFSKFKRSEGGVMGPGMYFTSNTDKAAEFARFRSGPELSDPEDIFSDIIDSKNAASVMPVYLRIKNPIHGRDVDFSDSVDDLKAKGYDGIIWQTDFIVFDPEQIKSAIGNKGTFDPNSSDITEEGDRSIDVKSFTDDIKAKYDLKDLWLIDMSNRNAIELSSIIVGRDSQKQGTGTKAMEEIVNFAESHRRILVLDPGLFDKKHGTTSQARLRKFYKRFGFIENKGRNKNYEFRQLMIRYPNNKINENTSYAPRNKRAKNLLKEMEEYGYTVKHAGETLGIKK